MFDGYRTSESPFFNGLSTLASWVTIGGLVLYVVWGHGVYLKNTAALCRAASPPMTITCP